MRPPNLKKNKHKKLKSKDILKEIEVLTDEMKLAAYELQFERAAELRDKIRELERVIMNEQR